MAAAKPKPVRRKYSIRVTGTAKQLQANHQKLWFPEKKDDASQIEALKTLVEPLKNGLSKYYENVEIKVVDKVKDLTSAQDDWGTFKLASKGLSGNTRLADVGGVPYMNDPKYHNITYQLTDIVKVCGLEKALVIGAGAASPTVVGKNSELICNATIPGARYTQFAKMDPLRNVDNATTDSKSNDNSSDAKDTETTTKTESKSDDKDLKSPENDESDSKSDSKKQVPFVGVYPSNETGCLANLFLSDGKQGPTLYLKVSKRKVDKSLNLAQCMREALNEYRSKNKVKEQIGMGGVFKVHKGKVKAHIMPDFANFKLETDEQVKNWLHFFEMGPNLVMFSTLITGDPTENDSMHLRCEHTHFYSTVKHKLEGGHYHYDVSKDIEYEGYFNLAEFVYRVEDAQFNIDNKKKGKK